MRRITTTLLTPVTDLVRCADTAVSSLGAVRGLGLLLAGCILGWFVYVPIHELAHAFGCILSGGTVTRLEIDPIYGGKILAMFFPWVHGSSEYAGRLSGFDTGGNDATYLVTVLFPYSLTILAATPALLALSDVRRATTARVLALGFVFPASAAPFLSLPGDYFEAGSIVATTAFALDPTKSHRLRSDDIFLLLTQLGKSGWTTLDVAVVICSLGLALLLAFLTHAAGRGFARAVFAYKT